MLLQMIGTYVSVKNLNFSNQISFDKLSRCYDIFEKNF